MSTLGAFVSSTLGAFNSTTLGARGPGDGGGLPVGVLFDIVYEGFKASTGFNTELRTWEVLLNIKASAAVFAVPVVGLRFTLTDTYNTVSLFNSYTAQFLPITTGTTVALRDTLITQGFTFDEYSEAAYYALEPWTRGSSVGQTRRELPIRPVGKAWPAYEIGSHRSTENPGGGIGAGRRPATTFSDLQTSLRRCRIGIIGNPNMPLPALTVPQPTIYLAHDYGGVGSNVDTGERGIYSRGITAEYAPTIEAGTGNITIQGVGPVSAVGSYRAKCPTFISPPQIEPVAIVARQAGTAIPNDRYFDLVNCLELDTSTVQDPGYVDNGFVATANGGYCIRFDSTLFGDLGGFDIYLTDTAKNADAILGNSVNFATDSWRTMYAN